MMKCRADGDRYWHDRCFYRRGTPLAILISQAFLSWRHIPQDHLEKEGGKV